MNVPAVLAPQASNRGERPELASFIRFRARSVTIPACPGMVEPAATSVLLPAGTWPHGWQCSFITCGRAALAGAPVDAGPASVKHIVSPFCDAAEGHQVQNTATTPAPPYCVAEVDGAGAGGVAGAGAGVAGVVAVAGWGARGATGAMLCPCIAPPG